MSYETATREPITPIGQEKSTGTIKAAMTETESVLGELRTYLSELNAVTGGKPQDEKSPGMDIANMADQAEVNRRLAASCLELAYRIKMALVG